MSACYACLTGSGSHNPECYHSAESVQKRHMESMRWRASEQLSEAQRHASEMERLAERIAERASSIASVLSPANVTKLRADLFRSQLAALTSPLLVLPDDPEGVRDAIEARVKLAWQYVDEAYPLQGGGE